MEQNIWFFEKCRLCLETAGVVRCDDGDDIANDIFDCTGVTISAEDNLPQSVCASCLEIVTKAKNLRILATKNQNFLHQLFGSDDEDSELIINVKQPFNPGPNTSTPIARSNENDEKSRTEIKNRNYLFAISTVSSSEDAERQKAEQIRLDNGQTLYKCGTCSKTYETWKKLYHHQRQHNKNYVCPLDACGKMFSSKSDLNKHQRVHTGEKPYRCDICNKRFTQKVTLSSHNANIHNIFT